MRPNSGTFRCRSRRSEQVLRRAGKLAAETRGTGPKRGAPTKGTPTARDRILTTATTLFYRDGIRATGVDTIVERAGISKTSLYRTFATKDELIAAVVGRQNQLYWSWWDSIAVKHAGDPRALLRALLSAIGDLVAGRAFRGCPFINAAAELTDPQHPGREIAQANKMELRRRLAAICRDVGCRNPARLAARLALLIDGAYMAALVSDPHSIKSDLLQSAFALIDAETRQ